MKLGKLYSLATLMGLEPTACVALATAITVCARKVSMSEAAFIEACMINEPLRAYVADACRTAIKQL